MNTPTQTQEERDKLHAEWLLSGMKMVIEYWSDGLGWMPAVVVPWDDDIVYREKPEKKRVPLEQKDRAPRDGKCWWAKHKYCTAIWLVVWTSTGTAFEAGNGISVGEYSMDYERSADWITWEPCSKEVEE